MWCLRPFARPEALHPRRLPCRTPRADRPSGRTRAVRYRRRLDHPRARGRAVGQRRQPVARRGDGAGGRRDLRALPPRLGGDLPLHRRGRPHAPGRPGGGRADRRHRRHRARRAAQAVEHRRRAARAAVLLLAAVLPRGHGPAGGMIRRLAALAAVAALVGCGSDRSTIVRGGRVIGPNLTIYSSLPRPGGGLGRDIVDAEKLAIAQAGGTAGDFGINFVSIGEGPLGHDAPVKVAAASAEQVIRDPQVIAVIGTLRSDTALTTVPLYNAAGILQVSLGAGYPGFTRPISPGEPEH